MITRSLPRERNVRKVRTPQGRMLGNSQAGRPDGKCNREQTADGLWGSHIPGAQVRVKRWCKRPPALRGTGAARQTPSGARSSRDRVARPLRPG